MKRLFHTIIIVLVFGLSGFTQPKTHLLYKQIDSTALYLDIFYPEKYDGNSSYPAIIFFFGGGWNSGSVKQFEPQTHSG